MAFQNKHRLKKNGHKFKSFVIRTSLYLQGIYQNYIKYKELKL